MKALFIPLMLIITSGCAVSRGAGMVLQGMGQGLASAASHSKSPDVYYQDAGSTDYNSMMNPEKEPLHTDVATGDLFNSQMQCYRDPATGDYWCH